MRVNAELLYRHVGGCLKRRRREIGMTQAQLAEAVGTLRTSIANIEAGRQRPPLHVLYALCAALGVELATILPGNAEIVPSATFPITAADVPPQAAAFLRELLAEPTDERSP